MRKEVIIFIIGSIVLTGIHWKSKNQNLYRAEETLKQIFLLYDSGHDNLLNETYPNKADRKVSYLSGADTITVGRVAYLWPTSGMFSGVNALLKTTGKREYRLMLANKVLPGLEQYFDTLRSPPCYQSYISKTGKSDRYYDDNVWLAIDFCESYELTGKSEYLQKAEDTWNFIISGWDDQLGGGIYWCEQKKQSKNTCSNAPASVLAFKLFEATGDSSYFNWGKRIYEWTKMTLQDSSDYLYFDNKDLSGKISKRKYTYNSGQMLQATALLYKLTGDNEYLVEAQNIARSAIAYFTEEYFTSEGTKIRLFKNTGNWFNAILLRGYAELYHLDKDDQYITVFRDNMNQVWNTVRTPDGLFSKDWEGLRDDEYKSLLDQASLVEIWATLAMFE